MKFVTIPLALTILTLSGCGKPQQRPPTITLAVSFNDQGALESIAESGYGDFQGIGSAKRGYPNDNNGNFTYEWNAPHKRRFSYSQLPDGGIEFINELPENWRLEIVCEDSQTIWATEGKRTNIAAGAPLLIVSDSRGILFGVSRED